MKVQNSFPKRLYPLALAGLTLAFGLFVLGFFLGRNLLRPAIITQRLAPAEQTLEATLSTEAGEPRYPIDPNTATAQDLDFLPGIGPVLAQQIVEYRESNGPFAQPADLMLVSGIGQAKLEAILPYITIGGTEDENTDRG